MSIHPDLQWLAAHVSQWPIGYASCDVVVDDNVVLPYGRHVEYKKEGGQWSFFDWQLARNAWLDSAMTPDSDMHPDLEWLARNVSEWVSQENLSMARKSSIGTDFYDPEYQPYYDGYTRAQWLQARKDLGLDKFITPEEERTYPEIEPMTPEEEEIPAEEWRAEKPDNVNKPKHYQLREGYEVYDLRQDLASKASAGGATYDQYSDWDRSIEYIIRMWGKNRLEDAKKGRWYLDKLISKLEAE